MSEILKRNLILLLVITLFSLPFVSSANENGVVTYRATFENNSITSQSGFAWDGGFINSTVPINGSYSYQASQDNVWHNTSHGMQTNNSFNVSFSIRQATTAGGCMRYGISNNAMALTPESHMIGFAMGEAGQCETGGDNGRLWVSTQAGLIDSGRTCAELNQGVSRCNITMEINATDSGSTADSVWRFFLNGFVNSTWYTTTGTMPVRKATSFFARGNPGNSLWIDDIRVWNGTSAPVGITINITSPLDELYSNQLLRVNVNASNNDGIEFTNISLIVNGTTNSTSTSVPNKNAFSINITSITDGDYNWSIRACVSGGCLNSDVRTYHFDNTSPSITLVNPVSAGNVSIFNLTTNITVQSSTLNFSNLTVYNPGGLRLYTLTLTTANDADNVYFNTVINFTTDGNYTVNISSRDKAGLETNTSTWYFFDKGAPNITIASPTHQQVVITQTPTLSFRFSDSMPTLVNCQYWIVRNSSGIQETPASGGTSFSCNSNIFINITSPQLTNGLEYTLHVNATDGINSNETIRNFNVSISGEIGGATESSGGGGGGSSTTTIIVAEEGLQFSITSDTGSNFYEFVILPGDYRNRDIVINNKKNAVDGIKLECLGKEICKWIELSAKTVTVGANQKKSVPFKISVPEGTPYGEYSGQIKASYKDKVVYLAMKASVSRFGFILKNVVIYPPVVLPAWSIGLVALFGSLLLSLAITSNFLQTKKNTGLAISIVISIVVTIATLFII